MEKKSLFSIVQQDCNISGDIMIVLSLQKVLNSTNDLTKTLLRGFLQNSNFDGYPVYVHLREVVMP